MGKNYGAYVTSNYVVHTEEARKTVYPESKELLTNINIKNNDADVNVSRKGSSRGMFQLPFGVDYVLEIDKDYLPNQKRWVSAKGFDITCPFCDGKRKLNVNNQNGLWRCAKCDESGNAITLHSKLTGLDNKESYKDLMNRYKGLPADQRATLAAPKKPEIEFVPAYLTTRDTFYQYLLENLTLSENHKRNLLERGLSEEEIIKYGYKTCPTLVSSIANKIFSETGMWPSLKNQEKLYLEQNQRFQIPGVAGTGKNIKIVVPRNGFFVPVRTRSGQIARMQIRRDMPNNLTEEQKEDFARYITFSSGNEENGVSSSGTENIHYVGFDFEQYYSKDYKTPKIVCLTEGALKADVAHSLSGWSFISLMGVGSQSQLVEELKFLKSHGTEKIMICFDADYREKQSVAKALNAAKEKITSVGLDWQMVNWDPQYKGIDDFLLARKKAKAS